MLPDQNVVYQKFLVLQINSVLEFLFCCLFYYSPMQLLIFQVCKSFFVVELHLGFEMLPNVPQQFGAITIFSTKQMSVRHFS